MARKRATFIYNTFPLMEKYFVLDGKRYSPKQFNKAFPVGIIDKSKNGQLDGRSNFLYS